MTSTNVTHAQLTEAVKAYRSYGSKIRAEVKAGRPDLFIDRNRRFQKVLVGKLAEAGHMDLVLALADEQVGLDGVALAKALYPSHEAKSYEVKSRELLRNARRRIKAMLSDVEADEALATLPTEVVAELTAKDVVNAMGSAMTATLVKAQAAEEPAVRTGGWYLVPAEGARLTDRHDVLGPYTTEDMADHLRETYAAEGIAGAVVQSATRPVLVPREPIALASEPHSLHMRRGDSTLVYLVLGSEGRGKSCGVHMISTQGAVYGIFRHLSELVEDGWVACETDGGLPTNDVPVPVVELHMRREYSSRVFRVVGTELGGVWLQALERSNDPIIRYGHELIEDLWIACEADGTPYEPDVSVMTLTELTRFRRDCAKTFNSPDRLDDASYKWAARFTEEIDQELYLREQTGLRASLITEATDVVTISHGERNDYVVSQYVHDELAALRKGINAHLEAYGHLVR